MTGPTCPKCGRIHGSDCVRALGRFGTSAPLYRANYPLSPAHRDPAEAEADWCHHHATREDQ